MFQLFFFAGNKVVYPSYFDILNFRAFWPWPAITWPFNSNSSWIVPYIWPLLKKMYPSFLPSSSYHPTAAHLAYIMSTTCRSCKQIFSTAAQREKHLQTDCLLREWILYLPNGNVIITRNAQTKMLECPCQNKACKKTFVLAKSLIKHLKKTGAWKKPTVNHCHYFIYNWANFFSSKKVVKISW